MAKLAREISGTTLRWERWPSAELLDSHLYPAGTPQRYHLRLRHKGKPIFEQLANLETGEDARNFVRRYGFLKQNASSDWVPSVLKEAEILHRCLLIWRGPRNHTPELKSWLETWGGIQGLFDLKRNDEWGWREAIKALSDMHTGGSMTLLSLAMNLHLERLRLSLVKGHQGVKWKAKLLLPWQWVWEIPDLLTFCYLELAIAMSAGRVPAICPFCGDPFVVLRKGLQKTCGKSRCKKAAQRQ